LERVDIMSKEFMVEYAVGDEVFKSSGDYYFNGFVVAVFQKKSGAVRYVVENEAGILHIFSEKQLTLSN
jgi:hypothetical protein